MNANRSQPHATPQKTLMMCRLIWAALLLGQVMFLFIVAAMIFSGGGSEGAVSPDAHGPDGSDGIEAVLFYVACGALVAVTPVAFFVRSQIYKANWHDNVVLPGGYFAGNLVFLAMFEGVSFFSIVVAMLQQSLIPAVAPMFIAMAIQVVNFPHGRPMQPHDGVFPVSGRGSSGGSDGASP